MTRLIKAHGLLEKQPGFYTRNILLTWGLLAVGLIFLAVTDNFWLLLLNAAYLAFVFTQISFLSHDAGHRQIFRAAWQNDIFCLVHTDLLLGMSYGWWVKKHNQHHNAPNQVDHDPDLDIVALALSEDQIQSKHGFLRFVAKYQAYFFFPLLLLTAFAMSAKSVQAVLQKKVKYPRVEALLISLHFALWFGLLCYWLGIRQALLFTLLQRALFGLYLGSVFAPNHKGMLILKENNRLDFLRQQVLTTRNVKAHPVTDFWYGALNYQIEHHLFPSMARNKLSGAQKIVRTFCREHAIPYYESRVLQSYREILQYLHQVSASVSSNY